MKDARTQPSVSVILPAKNEAGTIEDAIRRIPEMGRHTQLVFVEDHSTDTTRDVLASLVRKYRKTRDIAYRVLGHRHGKFAAVQTGIGMATGDIVIILDADLTVRPEDLPQFYDAVDRDPDAIAIGSRFALPMERQAMSLANRIINRVFAGMFNGIAHTGVTDILCGTKAFWRVRFPPILRAVDGHPADPFGEFSLVMGAARLGMTVREIPVRYYARIYGASSVRRFRNGWQLFRFLLWAAVHRDQSTR